MRPPVVVVGLDCPTGLQTARVFAARGIEVIGVAVDLDHPCVRTRRCRRVVRAEPGADGVVAALRKLGSELDEQAVLIPCTDLAVLGIARHRVELAAHYLLAVPPVDVIELLLDKARFAEFAERHGLPIPITRVLRSREDAEAAAAFMEFPCVFKPSVKGVDWVNRVPAKAFVVDSPESLLTLYDRHQALSDAFVVQQWIEGGDTDHYTCDCYLTSADEPLVTFCTRKLRQWPPVVGQACFSVEHRNDAIREEATRVLREAGHRGQGYVEMKWDARSGRHLIIEANVGRPTGRSAAAERAGVELLMTVYCDLTGRPLPAERVQRFRGTKWIHIRRDVQACLYMLYHRRTTVRDVFRNRSGRYAFALFSASDPVPFFADLATAVRAALPARAKGRDRQMADPAKVEKVLG